MTPEIRYLARTYFHQDFDLDADTPTGVVQLFRAKESAEKIAALQRSIEQLLQSGQSEDQLTSLWLDEAGAQYDPRDDGVSVSEWLRQVVHELSKD